MFSTALESDGPAIQMDYDAATETVGKQSWWRCRRLDLTCYRNIPSVLSA